MKRAQPDSHNGSDGPVHDAGQREVAELPQPHRPRFEETLHRQHAKAGRQNPQVARKSWVKTDAGSQRRRPCEGRGDDNQGHAKNHESAKP